MSKSFQALALLLLAFFSASAQSQMRIIDSVKSEIKNPKLHDTTRLNIIMGTMDNNVAPYGHEYHALNKMLGTLAEKKYQKGKKGEPNRSYTVYRAIYHNIEAIEYYQKFEFGKALEHVNKSIVFFQEGDEPGDVNGQKVLKASIYTDMKQYEKAIATLADAIKSMEKMGDAENIAYSQVALGNIYQKQRQNEKAVEYFGKAVSYYENQKDLAPEFVHLMGVAYTNKGTSEINLKRPDAALVSLEKALTIMKQLGSTDSMSMILGKIGNIKIHQGKLEEAEKFLNQAISISPNPATTAHSYLRLGELAQKKQDFKKADFYYSTAYQMGIEIHNADVRQEASGRLSIVNKELGNYKKALEMSEVYRAMIDSTKLLDTKNKLEQYEMKSAFEKKELNYKLESERKTAVKNNWLIGLGGVLLLLILGGFFYYRNNKQKQSIASLEKNQIKQKLLISQMNPHFIFNSVENIRSLIRGNQNDLAVDYLSKFSRLTRQILEYSNENYISLSEEKEMIENYLSIQQLLYENKFNFSVSVAEEIDQDTIFLPPMLTQPFIENAIKHGLRNKADGGKVSISFYLKSQKLMFEVTDNGSGFEDHAPVANHKSLAMTITKERLVNYTKNQDFVVTTDNIIGPDNHVTGAKVVFEIPYIYEN